MSLTLPPLPYALDALEPYTSRRTLALPGPRIDAAVQPAASHPVTTVRSNISKRGPADVEVTGWIKSGEHAMRSVVTSTSVTAQETFGMAALSSALVPIFRGRFCDLLLPNRVSTTFADNEVIYEQGDKERTFFFVRRGVVKTGTITGDGREIIYDLRKEGDVVGELCALDSVRRDRAVAVERTEVVPVAFDEVVETLAKHPALLRDFLGIFCSALSEAYDQVDRLAVDSVVQRLVNVLQTLAKKLGRPLGEYVEIAAYLTQEELSQMVVARRERVSTAFSALRRQGIARYSPRGHLLLDMQALERYRAGK